MLKFIVSLSVIACALGAAFPEGGLLPVSDGRIVGGFETDITKYPYQVSLQRNGRHSCGGSIISQRCIVTAAHCMADVAASALTIRVGSTAKDSGGQLFSVEKTISHEGYNPSTLVNDIGLLVLATDIKYNSFAQPIAPAKVNPPNGAAAVVSGWGTMSFGGSSPTNLRCADVEILLQKECAGSNYGYGSLVKYPMICTKDDGKDACQGDSGGPLVSDGLLVGIVSWGNGCAFKDYPGVYTDVAAMNSWIVRNCPEI